MKKTIVSIFTAAAAGLILLSSCSARNKQKVEIPADSQYSDSMFAMDTYITVTAYGENAQDGVDAARNEITRLEKMWSVTDENSEIYEIDHSGGREVTVSPETAELLDFACQMHKSTGGVLDISLYPVLRAWGFTTGEYSVPTESELAELLSHKGVEKIAVNEDTVCLPVGMEIDLGAVAKGASGDFAAKALKEKGVASALLDLGGNIQTVGETKPDGTRWKVGIRDPFGDGTMGVLEMGEGVVITSGGYERFFEKDGIIYKHILDPETGRPAESGLASATVIGSEGRKCDALSTSLYVMGLESAEEYWRKNGDFEMILIGDDGSVHITEGIEDNFSSSYAKPAVIRK